MRGFFLAAIVRLYREYGRAATSERMHGDTASGGPNFLGAGASETRVIAATTITGDSSCRSTNVDYRLDTPSARSFLANFVSLP
jgi:hypothetical protein